MSYINIKFNKQDFYLFDLHKYCNFAETKEYTNNK